VSTATTAQSATFDGFGRLVNVGTDIQRIAISYPTGSTSSGDRALRVEITPAGQIRMCDPAAGSGDARHCDY
jgi:type IV fimbrial biogenesis protein FimT